LAQTRFENVTGGGKPGGEKSLEKTKVLGKKKRSDWRGGQWLEKHSSECRPRGEKKAERKGVAGGGKVGGARKGYGEKEGPARAIAAARFKEKESSL